MLSPTGPFVGTPLVVDSSLKRAIARSDDDESGHARHAVDLVPGSQFAARTNHNFANRAKNFVWCESISGAFPFAIEFSVFLRNFVEARVVENEALPLVRSCRRVLVGIFEWVDH